MTLSTAQQTSAAQPNAQPAEPSFLLSGTASDALWELAHRFPRLLTAQTMRELPAKLPATRGYDFRNARLLSEVLNRLCSDLKLPALVRVAQQWRKLRAIPQAAVMTSAEWDAVLAGRAQLSSPARFARHGHAVESWSSPWVQAKAQAERGAPFLGPALCCHCAVDGISPSGGRLFYFPHGGDCEPQCSGLDGRCGSPLCNGCCVGCIRGRDPECSGVCGAGGPCQVFVEASPGSEDGEWVDPDALPLGQQPVIEALRGGPCVVGAGNGAQHEQPDNEDDRQDAPAEQQIALAEPQPIKPVQPAPKPVAPSQPKPAKQTATDDKDAKRLTPPPTVKPQRKPLDVAGALAALRR